MVNEVQNIVSQDHNESNVTKMLFFLLLVYHLINSENTVVYS